MLAIMSQASALAVVASKSLARRRLRPNQAKVRSTMVEAADGKGGVATAEVRVNVYNVPPVLSDMGAPIEVATLLNASLSTATSSVAATSEFGVISGPVDPVAVGAAVSISGTFTDAGIMDRHSARWDWGDGTTSVGTVNQGAGSGSVTDTHSYDAPGIYAVTLTIDDGTDQGFMTLHEVVVYDAAAGAVTGGGAFASPPGILAADPSAAGRARFSFRAMYRGDAPTPSGRFKFRFRAGPIKFRSNGLDWLVITANRAQIGGTGTLDGAGGYAFSLTAVDGRASRHDDDRDDHPHNGRAGDRIRIKITDVSTGATIYDGLETSLRSGDIRIRVANKSENRGHRKARHRRNDRDDD